jgi:hypothetical protein
LGNVEWIRIQIGLSAQDAEDIDLRCAAGRIEFLVFACLRIPQPVGWSYTELDV